MLLLGLDQCEETCRFGGNCVPIEDHWECACDFDCTAAEYRPLCGSDGMTHSNECEMKRSSCMKQQKILNLKDEECSGVSLLTGHVMSDFL